MPFDPSSDMASIVGKYSIRINNAFSSAIRNVRARLTIEGIVDKLSNGGMYTVLTLFDDLEEEIGKDLVGEIVSASNESGKMIATSLGDTIIKQPFVFNVLDSRAVTAINSSNANLIHTLSDNTKLGVMALLEDSIKRNYSPEYTAQRVIDGFGLTTQQQVALQNYRRGLEGNWEANVSAPEKLSVREINRRYKEYRNRLLENRFITVGENEAKRAVSIGEYESLQQAKVDGKMNPKLRRYWKYTMGERSRAAHRSIPGMNPDGVSIDESFQTPLGLMRYPRDPSGTAANTINCKCILIYSAEGE